MSVTSVTILLVAKILSETSVTLVFSNPLARRYRIPPGATYATGVDYVAGVDRRDSNIEYQIMQYNPVILHGLATPDGENTYKSGAMLTDQAILMDPDFWKVAGVYEVIGVPELTPPERIGNVYEYTVSAQVAINP
jgi:hypothetical protein